MTQFTPKQRAEFIATANALTAVRDNKFWRGDYESFNAYCIAALGINEEVAEIYIAAAKRIEAAYN